MLISSGNRRTAKYLVILFYIQKKICAKKIEKLDIHLDRKNLDDCNVCMSNFTVKTKWIGIKVNERIFLITKLFVRICTFCRHSVMSALKLVFPAENFPNLGKTIIYQELFTSFTEIMEVKR